MRRRMSSVYWHDDMPGDVMLINNSGRVVVVSPYDMAQKVSEGFTPYGVVVVPSSHNTYGDGTMGVLSLRNTGYIPFGPYGHDPIFDRFQYEYGFGDDRGWKFATLDTVGPIPTGSANPDYCPLEFTKRIAQNVIVASDYFENGIESCNPSYKYPTFDYAHETSVAPNLFNPDGTMNPLCISNSGNWFLFDYDGFGNTKYIYEKYGSKWNNLYGDNNEYHVFVDVSEGQYPIIEKAVNFDVKGRWYLPGLGEFQYIAANFKKIQSVINSICKIYKDCELILDAYFASTIAATKFRKNNESEDKERDRCTGFWFDCSTSNTSVKEMYYMTSFGDDKNRTLRGRFMCRYSYRDGFKNILD